MDLFIVGTGGHARVVADAALDAGLKIKGFIDLDYKGQKEEVLSFPVLGGLSLLDKYNAKQILITVAVGDNKKRADLCLELKIKGFIIVSIIHPTAIISKHAIIGCGCFINTGSIINADAIIGDNCIINTGVIVEHGCQMGDHCHLAPGVRLGGHVSIGKNSFIGIGTSINHCINIGHDVTVGAGSVIIRDVESNTTVVGVPARKVQ